MTYLQGSTVTQTQPRTRSIRLLLSTHPSPSLPTTTWALANSSYTRCRCTSKATLPYRWDWDCGESRMELAVNGETGKGNGEIGVFGLKPMPADADASKVDGKDETLEDPGLTGKAGDGGELKS